MVNRDAAAPQSAPQPVPGAPRAGDKSARRALLTDLGVRKLKPGAQRFELWDSSLVGFGVRVAPTGRKAWILRYRIGGIQRRELIGKPWTGAEPVTPLKDARDHARARLALVSTGVDPVARDEQEAAAAALPRYTVADLARDFLADGRSLKSHRRAWRPRTRAEFERIVQGVIVPRLGALQPEHVNKRDVRTMLEWVRDGQPTEKDAPKRQAPTMSNRVLDVVRLMWRWAAEHDRVESVPAWPLPLGAKTTRDRTLTDGELAALWRALDHEPTEGTSRDDGERVGFLLSCAFKLLLLTAQRRNEVLRMRWQDLADERQGRTVRTWWTLPAEFTKANRKHRVPLSPQAAAVVESLRPWSGLGTWVFPSPHAGVAADPKRSARAAAKLERRRAARGVMRRKAYAGAGHIANPQKAAERMWSRAGITGAHLHDLRRTAATLLASMRFPRVVIGKVLNHAEQGVTGAHYDLYAYDTEKAKALDALAARIAATVTAERQPSKIVPFAGGR